MNDARMSGAGRSQTRCRDASGASLAGVLVVVVVLGGLAAVSVIGVNAMSGSDDAIVGSTIPVTTGSARDGTGGTGLGGVVAPAATAACTINADAAKAASAAYSASNGGTYPTTWSELTAPPSPVFELPDGVAIEPDDPAVLDAQTWQLRMAGGGTAANTFACTFTRP
jgi:hypothetical protein